MLEKILEFERELFLFLNHAHSPVGDQFMWFYSGKIAWIPVIVCFFIILFYANRSRWKEMLLIVGAIVLIFLLCDQFANLCKDVIFKRFRPTRHPDFMNDVITVFGYKGGRYGFISGHAANGFGFAMLTSLIFRNKVYAVLLFLWATVSAYSRIYLGVHFISDIIAGILAGLFFGWVTYKLFVFAHKKIFDNDPSQTLKGLPLILSLLVATVIVMAIVSVIYAY
jgi:undecaprenyl-diphosphatase